MASPDGTALLRSMRAVLDRRKVSSAARRLGVVRRDRKVDIFVLVATLTLAFQVGASRSLDGLRKAYERTAGQTVARSAFYARLSPRLAKLLHELAQGALHRQLAGARMPSGRLAGFKELLAIDSTVLHLHDLLAGTFAACRTNSAKAAAKLHVVVNVLDGSARRLKLTGERTSDVTPWKRVEDWVRGRLLLFDLGYYRFHLFDRIDAHGGFFLTRAKTTFNPKIVATHRTWRGRSVEVVGQRLRDVLPKLQREVLDVEVEVGFEKRAYRNKRGRWKTRTFRVVAVRDDKSGEYHVYITNVPAEMVPAEDVTRTYALRWQIELLFKALKTHGHLEQLPSSKRAIVECLVWASVLAALVSQELYREVRRVVADTRFLPQLRWAGIFGALAASLLHLLTSRATLAQASRLWQHLLREAPNPNVTRPKRAFDAVPLVTNA